MSHMHSQRSRAEMLKEWRLWAERIAREAEKVLPDAAVYILGSIVRGDYTGGSDIDILIVSDKMPEGLLKRAELKGLIEEMANLPSSHPIQIHLANHKEAVNYMRRSEGHIINIKVI